MRDLEILRETGKSKNEFYEISVGYQKGGTNFATYRQEARGIYIHFAIAEISQGCRSMMLFGDTSFKILYKELGRKSKKQEQLAYEFLKENEDDLMEAYINMDKNRLLEIVQKELEVA